jgi:translation initiation factor 2D
VETRAGNKKVTMINNIAVFGVDAKDFARLIQIGVAASANVIAQAPNCDGPQVIVQGNQVLHIQYRNLSSNL